MSAPERVSKNSKITEPVGIDFDGVVTNHTIVKSELFEKLGYDVDPEETDRWNCVYNLEIPEEDYNKVSKQANLSLQNTPLRDGVKMGVEHLIRNGFSPVIVTSRYNDEAAEMVEFLEKSELSIEWYLNTSREPKFFALQKIDAIAHIDDSYYKIENIISESEKRPCELLFFRHPANDYIESSHDAVSEVKGWKEVIQHFSDSKY